MRIINTYREAVPPSDVLSPEDILRICCKPTPVDECSEIGKVSPYEGADAEHRDFDEQAALEQARAENPGKRIIGVRSEGIGARPGQPCGELHESWTGALNCCDKVEPMVWDAENSVEVLAPNTVGVVGVTGGAPPYHWSVRGLGFALNEQGNLRDGFTDTPYVLIYALHLACGTAPIEVTDGCSIISGNVRSTVGEWNDECRVYLATSNLFGEWNGLSVMEACTDRIGMRENGNVFGARPRCQGQGFPVHWAGFAWFGEGHLPQYCSHGFSNYCDCESLNAAIATVSGQVQVVAAYPSGPPDGSEYRDIDGWRCKWLC